MTHCRGKFSNAVRMIVPALMLLLGLSSIGYSQSDMNQLIEDLKDKNERVRRDAAMALGELSDAHAVEPLLGALSDKDLTVRRVVLQSLLKIDPNWRESEEARDAVYRYVNILGSGRNPKDRHMAAIALDTIDDNWRKSEAAGEAIAGLISALKHKDISTRRGAAYALGKIGDDRACEPLAGMLGEEDAFVRQDARTALGRIDPNWQTRTEAEKAVLYFITALKNEDRLVRREAARGLGEIRHARSVDPLVDALVDDDSRVRRNAAWALGEIGNKRAVGPLTDTTQNDISPEVRRTAISALRKIESERKER